MNLLYWTPIVCCFYSIYCYQRLHFACALLSMNTEAKQTTIHFSGSLDFDLNDILGLFITDSLI